jgi:hypothetical protein
MDTTAMPPAPCLRWNPARVYLRRTFVVTPALMLILRRGSSKQALALRPGRIWDDAQDDARGTDLADHLAGEEGAMRQTITLTAEQYAVLVQAGAARRQDPAAILAEWIEALRMRYSHVSRVRRVKDDPGATQPSARRPPHPSSEARTY